MKATLYYFPVNGFMSGYKAGVDQEFSGQELERAKASGVWHSKAEFDSLWEAHQKAQTPAETPETQTETVETQTETPEPPADDQGTKRSRKEKS
jgi:hypothetical protein